MALLRDDGRCVPEPKSRTTSDVQPIIRRSTIDTNPRLERSDAGHAEARPIERLGLVLTTGLDHHRQDCRDVRFAHGFHRCARYESGIDNVEVASGVWVG